jgi:hypothetical protein
MEIYTSDLTNLATDYAGIIERKINMNNGKFDYIIQDECCSLMSTTRKLLYTRLSASFNTLVEQSKTDKDFDLKTNLFKIINDL